MRKETINEKGVGEKRVIWFIGFKLPHGGRTHAKKTKKREGLFYRVLQGSLTKSDEKQ